MEIFIGINEKGHLKAFIKKGKEEQTLVTTGAGKYNICIDGTLDTRKGVKLKSKPVSFMILPATISLKGECPKCDKGSLYAYSHTPASDHPELSSWYVECNTCDYEEGDSYPTLEYLSMEHTIKFFGDSFEDPEHK